MFESTIKPRFTKKNIKKLCNKITHNPKSKNKLLKKNIKLKCKKTSKSKKVVTKPIKTNQNHLNPSKNVLGMNAYM